MTYNPNEEKIIPWPNSTDRVFAPRPKATKVEGQSNLDAVFASLREDPEYNYRDGYYQAAKLLASTLTQAGYSDLYYPMLYCYRHYIELSLKSIIKSYAKLNDESAGDLKTHKLMPLWKQARALLEKTGGGPPDGSDTLGNVERYINAFNMVDYSSELFRYATDNAGQPTAKQLPFVKVEQFVNVMENLNAFLEAVQSQAADWQEYQDDMRREYEQEYRRQYESDARAAYASEYQGN